MRGVFDDTSIVLTSFNSIVLHSRHSISGDLKGQLTGSGPQPSLLTSWPVSPQCRPYRLTLSFYDAENEHETSVYE
jgi:hypothetical protein